MGYTENDTKNTMIRHGGLSSSASTSMTQLTAGTVLAQVQSTTTHIYTSHLIQTIVSLHPLLLPAAVVASQPLALAAEVVASPHPSSP